MDGTTTRQASNKPPEMTLKTQPATRADADELTAVYYDAFKTDHGNTYWWPGEREPMIAWMKRRTLLKMADPSVRHYKISDLQTGDLIAWTRWDIPNGYGAEFSRVFRNLTGEGEGEEVLVPVEISSDEQELPAAVTTASGAATATALEHPEGTKSDLARGFFDVIARVSQKWDAKKMLGLSLLCTSPKFHRRGAGTALLLSLTRCADQLGLKAYLEATPMAKPLYEKVGFREVDEILFDLGKLTEKRYDETYKLSIMIRVPQQV